MRRWFILALLAVTGLGAAALGGAGFAHFEIWPYRAIVFHLTPTGPTHTENGVASLSSEFIDLEFERFEPRDMRTEAGLGGTLASYGENALLLEGDGRLSLLSIATLEAQPLDLPLPPTGLAAVMAPLESGERPAHQRYFWHRYSSVLHHDGMLYLIYSNYSVADACFTSRLARLALQGPI